METPFRGLQLRDYTGCVIRSEFHVSYAAWPGAHGVVCCFEGDGAETDWVVGSYRGGDHVEECGAGRTNAEGTLRSYHRRTEVEGIPLFPRDETFLHGAKFGYEVYHGGVRELGKGDASRGFVHAGHVFVGAEKP